MDRHARKQDPAAACHETDVPSSDTLRPEEQGFFSGSSSADPDGVASLQLESLPASLGDYVLIEEIGIGGMGVVYRAQQLSAKRTVALKVIRPDRLNALSDDQRDSVVARFRNEATATARLQHDNIVTVHEVGACEGRHFFSMQLVEGQSLDARLREGPLDNRAAAQLMEPIARALHAAHRQGILHRDLKPANILIDSRLERPLVADFGLAKILTNEGELTRWGELIGTPQYMSPEQAEDSAFVTAAADTYAIGATLYHVLCGRPPFHAAQPWDTVKQLLYDEPVRPRQLNAAIDRDLETICLKCLEKDPLRRYATAEQVAEELRRYLDGVPLVARPVGRIERVWRWCRRNPAVASLTAIAGVLLLVAIVGIALEGRRARRAEVDAHNAVNTYFTTVSEDELLNQEGLQPLRRELLQKALSYYLHFLEQGRGDPVELGLTYYRVARITADLGSSQEALSWYRRALALQRDTADKFPTDVERRRSLATTVNAYAAALVEAAHTDEAERAFRWALRIREELFATGQDPRLDGRKLANTRMNLGLHQKEQRRYPEAKRHMMDAQQLRSRLRKQFPQDAKLSRDLGLGYYNLANLATASEEPTAAVELLEKHALPTFQALLTQKEAVLEDRCRIALCLRLLGDVQRTLGEYEQARTAYNQGREIVVHLAALNPAVPRYGEALAEIHSGIGCLELEQLHPEEAQASFKSTRDLLTRLSDADPQNADLRRELAMALFLESIALSDMGEIEFAERQATTSLSIWEKLIREWPDNEVYAEGRRGTRDLLAGLRLVAGLDDEGERD